MDVEERVVDKRQLIDVIHELELDGEGAELFVVHVQNTRGASDEKTAEVVDDGSAATHGRFGWWRHEVVVLQMQLFEIGQIRCFQRQDGYAVAGEVERLQAAQVTQRAGNVLDDVVAEVDVNQIDQVSEARR